MDEKRGSGASEYSREQRGTKRAGSESLEARRQRLDAELLCPPQGGAGKVHQEAAKGYALAVKLSSEFIAGVIVGALLGYLFDRFRARRPGA
jgi:ATP synthase protein I